MELLIATKNNLLALETPVQEGKEYSHICAGKNFSDYDHKVVVYHKREFKKLAWKDIGYKMSVLYLADNNLLESNATKPGLFWPLTWFQGFNEEKGQKYYFLHTKRSQLSKMNITADINNRKALQAYESHSNKSLSSIIHSIATAAFIYGKWSTKSKADTIALQSITIQVPLISQNINLIERWKEAHQTMQANGYFNSLSTIDNQEGTIVQYSISDQDILKFITGFDIAKSYSITKKISNDQLTEQLIEYCEKEKISFPTNKNQTIKFLTKHR